jgi:hypothetical protein
VPKVIGALAGLPGIVEANAFYPEKEAQVIYDPALIGVSRIVQGLSQAGYVAALKGSMEFPSDPLIMKNQEPSEFQSKDLICYCFGYTRDDIEEDFLKNSYSLILEKITAEKKAGGCDCVNKNPKGR